MARNKADNNASILEYALHHLEQERDEIQGKIDHIQKQLGRRNVAAPPAEADSAPAKKSRKKRVLSEGARKRIAAAQKKRWAEHRKTQAKAE